jgi:hypothetical protein
MKVRTVLSALTPYPSCFLRAETHTGDISDIKRVCKHVMNKAVTKRIISKQEACVLLGELDLVTCTETIQNISISNSKLFSVGDENRSTSPTKTFINEYKSRPQIHERLSLHEYFHATRNTNPNSKIIIPNFVGINGAPKYPVTDSYARHTLIVHRPWRSYPDKLNWRQEFETFINSAECPVSAKVGYQRVMRRYIDKMTQYEPKATPADHSNNPIEPDDDELMALVGLKGHDDTYDEEEALYKQMHRGLNHNWGEEPKVWPIRGPGIDIHTVRN